MTDLSTVVEYDRVYNVEVKLPNGDPSGITVGVVSKDSRRVVDATRKAQSEYFSKLAQDIEDVEFPDLERIVLIHCIDSWDWSDNSFAHISGTGKPSLEDRQFIIDHPNSKWIRDSISVATARLENFSQLTPKTARRGSKKT